MSARPDVRRHSALEGLSRTPRLTIFGLAMAQER
jgi:hypothetical protein